MTVAMLTLNLYLHGCNSLKEKRSRIKPLVMRLHREFNISAAEMDYLDSWQNAQIACVIVSNDSAHNQRSLQHIVDWLERYWPDVEVVSDQIEQI